MSLNDIDPDDTRDLPLVDNDLIQQPSAIAPVQKPIVIIPETDTIKAQSVMSEQELQKLPGMDVSFKLVQDGQTKLIELKDVESEIIAQEAINRAGAEYIQVAFEGFLKGPVRLAEFTQSPTQTHYGYALKHMAERIAQEEAGLVANFQLLIDQPTEDGKLLLQQLQVSYIPAVLSQLYSLRGQVLGLAERLRYNKDLVVPYQDGFTNLGKIDLKSLDAELIGDKSFDKPSLKATVSSIQMLLKCPYVNALVFTVNEGKSYGNIMDAQSRMSYQGCALTIFDLIEFFGGDVDSILHAACTQAEQALLSMTSIQEESAKHKQTPEMNAQFINSSMLELQECYKSVSRLCHLVNDLSCLSFSGARLIKFYQTL